MYCINKSEPWSKVKAIRSIVRKMTEYSNEEEIEELRTKFLEVDDDLANDQNWGVILEISSCLSTNINDSDFLDALYVILTNLQE